MSEATTAPAAEGTKDTTTPVFGAASTFGGGSGFAGFTGVDAAASPGGFGGQTSSTAAQGDDDEGGAGEGEEDCSAEFKPVVQLDEVEVQTGEEAEEEMANFKCKLYRYDQGSGEWKERGVGPIKLLRHKENDRIRLLMRQDKTLKIRANHIVMPGTRMQEHSGSEKSVVWSAVDFADEEQRTEMFCARFASQERAQEFIGKHGEAMAHNDKVLDEGEADGAKGEAGAEDGDAAAQGGADAAAEAPAQASDADALAEKVGGVKVDDAASPAAGEAPPKEQE